MFQNSTYWKFAEFKAKHKHTHYRQGQANLWLEIIGWVLWLEGKKKTHATHEERVILHSSLSERVLHETKHAS